MNTRGWQQSNPNTELLKILFQLHCKKQEAEAFDAHFCGSFACFNQILRGGEI
jgi:hypothetical protein